MGHRLPDPLTRLQWRRVATLPRVAVHQRAVEQSSRHELSSAAEPATPAAASKAGPRRALLQAMLEAMLGRLISLRLKARGTTVLLRTYTCVGLNVHLPTCCVLLGVGAAAWAGWAPGGPPRSRAPLHNSSAGRHVDRKQPMMPCQIRHARSTSISDQMMHGGIGADPS